MLWKSIEPTGGSTTPKAHFASNWNQIAQPCGTYPPAKWAVAAVENLCKQKKPGTLGIAVIAGLRRMPTPPHMALLAWQCLYIAMDFPY